MFDENSIARILGKTDAEQVFDPAEGIAGKAVMVTGAGGFIGARLCLELCSFKPSVLILVDLNEHGLYQIHRKIREQYPDQQVIPLMSNYGDMEQMARAIGQFEVQTVFHVGAYKHVPLVERNPISAIKNNVFAAFALFNQCGAFGVKNLVVVSSDKAVNPTNVMGATKRLVEYLALSWAYKMKVQVVRFGNVMWSTGSVLPLFYEQLIAEKAITITDRDADRYFMTVQQAVGLILQSMFLPTGIFCFDMGKPVNIFELSQRLAKEVHGLYHWPIEYIGLRPGEKLHEELTLGDKLEPTDHPQIMQAHEPLPDPVVFLGKMGDLTQVCARYDLVGVRRILKELVSGYAPTGGVVDDLWLSRMAADMEELDDCFRIPSPSKQ